MSDLCGSELFFILFKKADQTESVAEETHNENPDAEWKEMDDFHMIIAETFHPYKDSSNLEPVKNHSSDLVVAAKKWIDSPIPEKVNNDNVKAKLMQLKHDAVVLDSIVKIHATDTVIASSLSSLHNTFHSIQEQWYEHHEGDHEHH